MGELRITFLEHSGFLVEFSSALALFDWWKGPLPTLSDKPLFCFVSHRHPDHFDPHVFTLDDGARDVTFLLGKGIRLSEHNLARWGISEHTAARCVCLRGEEHCAFGPLQVETLRSTDEGVAFLVTADGRAVYHAGDLNWWHWEGEEQADNRNMEANFKRFIEPLRGRLIDTAFVPLDPRQGEFFGWGLEYLLTLCSIRRVFPMHQWEDYRATARFCAAHPELANLIIPVSAAGQSWLFEN